MGTKRIAVTVVALSSVVELFHCLGGVEKLARRGGHPRMGGMEKVAGSIMEAKTLLGPEARLLP